MTETIIARFDEQDSVVLSAVYLASREYIHAMIAYYGDASIIHVIRLENLQRFESSPFSVQVD